MSQIEKIAKSISDDIDVIIDKRFPFPDYEVEITWKEWRWNDARTDRLDDYINEGVCVNPESHLNEDGSVNLEAVYIKVHEVILDAYLSDNRAGDIQVIA